MFSDKNFINASRNWVCVRLESFESELHQKWVRRFLDGRFANTAFCLLSPDGDEWLSPAGRSPDVLGDRESILKKMNEIPKRYKTTGDASNSLVQDFHSLKQSVNVASADQRVLVVVSGNDAKTKPLRESLRPIASDKDVIGRYHFDFESDKEALQQSLKSSDEGILLVISDEFGQSGKIVKKLPLDADSETVISALEETRKAFVETTEKKVYSEHITKGRREGISYKSNMPWGEDRDGDGKIDNVGGGKRLR